MSLKVANFAELEWKDFPPIESARFGARWAPLADRLGAKKLGYGSWIVPLGKVSVPYHYHLVNEELAIVLGGEVWIRLDGRHHRLEAGDVVAMPPAPRARTSFSTMRIDPHNALASTKIPREVVEYPDPGKRAYAVAGLAGDPAMERIMTKEGRIVEGMVGYLRVSRPASRSGSLRPGRRGRSAHRSPRRPGVGGVPWVRSARRGRVGRAAGARLLGYSVYRVAPAAAPGRFTSTVNEEFFYVRRGYGQLRDKEGTRDIKPGDGFACPPGPEGAHALLNTGDAPFEVFALSTMEEPRSTSIRTPTSCT